MASSVIRKEPCERCGSKDNKAIYDDGHWHCFTPGCDNHGGTSSAEARGTGEEGGYGEAHTGRSGRNLPADAPPVEGTRPLIELPVNTREAFDSLKDRKIDSATLQAFGYFRATFGAKLDPVQVAPYRDDLGNIIGQKLRFRDKTFKVLGESPSKCQLFGQHLWGANYNRRVVLTEGEIDAMSVYQATNGKCPVVSIGSGAQSALKHIRRNLEWLLRFEQIIIWFDDDESGQVALSQVAEVFRTTTCRVAFIKTGEVMSEAKDASDILKAGRPGDINTATWNAKPYVTAAIASGHDFITEDELCAAEENRLSFPWPILTRNMDGGCKYNDVVGLISGSGRGKTTVLSECISHWIKNEGKTVGAMFFEDTAKDILWSLMTIEDNRPYRSDLSGVDRRAVWQRWVSSGIPEKFFVFQNEKAEWSFDKFLGYIHNLVKACGCQIVIADPFSYLASKIASGDERRDIDKALAEIAAMTKALGFTFVYSHHVTKEGEEGLIRRATIRGSNGFLQFSAQILGLQPPVNGMSPVSILKNRWAGSMTDKLVTAFNYEEATGRLLEKKIAETSSRGTLPVIGDFYDSQKEKGKQAPRYEGEDEGDSDRDF